VAQVSGRSPAEAGSGHSPKGGAAKASPAKPSVPNATVAVLAKARSLIEPRGKWAQGGYVNGVLTLRHAIATPEKVTGYCALGALGAACGTYPDQDPRGAAGIRLLVEAANLKPDGVTDVDFANAVSDWNDTRRSKKSVIEAFKRAEQIAREQVPA
jgi:hypothetical protein